MKKGNQLQDWLRNKPKNRNECDHTEEYWCEKCVNGGVIVDWRKEGLGRGHIISNIPLDL